jgi:hypothetical protein
MALSLLNHLDSDGDNHPKEGDAPESPDVWGCRWCGFIFELNTFTWSRSILKADSRYCPCCSELAEKLGKLPWVIEDKGFYLIGDDGSSIGPYKDEEEAQSHLWDWFELKRDGNGKEKGSRKEIRKGHLRLVSIQEDSKEGGQERAAQEADQTSRGETKSGGEKWKGGSE